MNKFTYLAAGAAFFVAGLTPIAVAAQEAGPDWTGTVTVNRDRQFNRAVTEYLIKEDLLGNSTKIDGDVNYNSTTQCNDQGACVSNTATNINGSNVVTATASENGSVRINAGADGTGSRQDADATTVTGQGSTTYIGE